MKYFYKSAKCLDFHLKKSKFFKKIRNFGQKKVLSRDPTMSKYCESLKNYRLLGENAQEIIY